VSDTKYRHQIHKLGRQEAAPYYL